MERRTIQRAPETRAEGDSKAGIITGYAAVYYDGTPGTEYELLDDKGNLIGVERVMPGAFERALQKDADVRGLFNHDADNVLGRTAAGTMALTSDEIGLRYVITPGNTSIAKDVLEMVNRKEVTGSSFSFDIAPGGAKWGRSDDGIPVRELTDLILFDAGPVTFPAYEATTASARSKDGRNTTTDNGEALASLKEHQKMSEQVKKTIAEYRAKAKRAMEETGQALEGGDVLAACMACVEACKTCTDACRACIDACTDQGGDVDEEMKECCKEAIRFCRLCAQTCWQCVECCYSMLGNDYARSAEAQAEIRMMEERISRMKTPAAATAAK